MTALAKNDLANSTNNYAGRTKLDKNNIFISGIINGHSAWIFLRVKLCKKIGVKK